MLIALQFPWLDARLSLHFAFCAAMAITHCMLFCVAVCLCCMLFFATYRNDTDLFLCRQASVTQSVGPLLRKNIGLHTFRPTAGGGQGCGCLKGKWTAHRVGHCPLHGPNRKKTVHDDVCREIVDSIRSIDQGASVLPRFGMLGLRRKRKGPSHYLDVLFVLGNGSLLAVEVDGASHSNKRAKQYDNDKDACLRACGVKIERVNLQSDWEAQVQQLLADVNEMNG